MKRKNMEIDETMLLDIDGTHQKVRVRSERAGLPPILVVQQGPGLPLLNEVSRFEKTLGLESEFTMVYWDQRGVGTATPNDARTVTFATQQRDVAFVVDWLAKRTGQKVLILGISIGATASLLAAAKDSSAIRALVAISIDVDLPRADASVYSAMLAQSLLPAGAVRPSALVSLGEPPYLDPNRFQGRARLLSNLGSIEYGKSFGAIMGEMVKSLVSTYGLFGFSRALGNMKAVQSRMLSDVAELNLFASWPRPAVPVHFIFGANDLLLPSASVKQVQDLLGPKDTLVTLSNAGHSVHFDQPVAVREIVIRAHSSS